MVCVWFSFSSGNVLVWSWYVFDIVLERFKMVLALVYFCLGLIQLLHGLVWSWYSWVWHRHSFSMAWYCYGNSFSIALFWYKFGTCLVLRRYGFDSFSCCFGIVVA